MWLPGGHRPQVSKGANHGTTQAFFSDQENWNIPISLALTIVSNKTIWRLRKDICKGARRRYCLRRGSAGGRQRGS